MLDINSDNVQEKLYVSTGNLKIANTDFQL